MAALINLGYEYVPEFERRPPLLPAGAPDTHHVHMVAVSSDFPPSTCCSATGCASIPRRPRSTATQAGLASRHRFDREAYRAGKVPIDTVVAAARREAGAQSSSGAAMTTTSVPGRPRFHRGHRRAGPAPARSMLRAVGFTDDDFERPQVGVASSWNEVTPATSTSTAWP